MRLCWRGQAFVHLNEFRLFTHQSGNKTHCFAVWESSHCDMDATEAKIFGRKRKIAFVHRRARHIVKDVRSRLGKTMQRGEGKIGGKAPRLAAYLAVGSLLLSPVLVPAVAAQIYGTNASGDWASRFTPSGVDSRLAERMRSNAMRQTAFPFTPAGLDSRGSNTLTVAARADAGNAVSMRNALEQIEAGNGSTLRLNNSNYQLTAARGWQAFTLPTGAAPQPRLDDIVGKGSFRLEDGAKKKPGRFGSDVSVAPPSAAAPSPRGSAAANDYDVNVGGRVRITKGVDLTAGVRYSRDNDRVDLATTKADSEAVYVGTKIRF